MRGVVTLAAAAGVPLVTASGGEFPGREAILALAFLVTIATLLIQGLTLPLLLRWLDLESPRDEQFEREQQERAAQIADAANTQALAAYRASHTSPASQRMADIMASRTVRAADAQAPAGFDRNEALVLGNLLLEARRRKLVAARDARELDDTVLRDLLEQMDLEQAFMDSMGERAGRT